MKKVSFLFVGFDKSGSTWLQKNLVSHPQVYVRKEKDLYFFDRYFSRGLKWYHSFFQEGFNNSEIKAIGELSHDYIYSYDAAKRIKEYNPDIKIIITFRNSIERYLSLLNFSVMKGSITKFQAKSVDRHPEITSRAIVTSYIKKYIELFDEKNILLLDFDDLKSDPKSFLKTFYQFIDVEDFFDKDLINKKINKTKSHRFFLFNWVVFRIGLFARLLGLNSLITLVRRNKIIQKILYKEDDQDKLKLDDINHEFIVKLNEDYQSLINLKNHYNE